MSFHEPITSDHRACCFLSHPLPPYVTPVTTDKTLERGTKLINYPPPTLELQDAEHVSRGQPVSTLRTGFSRPRPRMRPRPLTTFYGMRSSRRRASITAPRLAELFSEKKAAKCAAAAGKLIRQSARSPSLPRGQHSPIVPYPLSPR